VWQAWFERMHPPANGLENMDSEGEEAEETEEEEHEAGEIFADYRPSKLPFGRPHPDSAVETASLAAVVGPLLF